MDFRDHYPVGSICDLIQMTINKLNADVSEARVLEHIFRIYNITCSDIDDIITAQDNIEKCVRCESYAIIEPKHVGWLKCIDCRHINDCKECFITQTYSYQNNMCGGGKTTWEKCSSCKRELPVEYCEDCRRIECACSCRLNKWA